VTDLRRLNVFHAGLKKTDLVEGAGGWETGWQLIRGCGPLVPRKNTVSLWLQFKFVQFGWKRRVELEGGRVKRRRLDETFGGTQEQVVADIGRILESKAGADIKIRTSCGKVFDVHRCILAGRLVVKKQIMELIKINDHLFYIILSIFII
jgi:hypothetical protein